MEMPGEDLDVLEKTGNAVVHELGEATEDGQEKKCRKAAVSDRGEIKSSHTDKL